MGLDASAFKRPRRWKQVVLAALVIAGCSQSAPEPPAAAPIRVEGPRATLPDGFAVRLELALSPEEIASGLMYRPSLAADRGMLFLFDEARLPSFWMKNTLIALDLVFLDAAGTVVDVIPEVSPCAADPCPTYSPESPALAVLELGAGSAKAHGIEPGVVLLFERVPNYPRGNQELGIRN